MLLFLIDVFGFGEQLFSRFMEHVSSAGRESKLLIG